MMSGKKAINFSDPLQGRKYLLLLREDPLSGIRFPPNLRLNRNVLGFTFSTNSLGLRGPCSANGPGVIFGTSFATGMSVDDGKNWYDLCLDTSEWLNLGLPVGTAQMEALLSRYYTGTAKTALVLYHPNFWIHSLYYKRWSDSNQSVASIWGWKTGFLQCLKLKVRKSIHAHRDRKSGRVIIFKSEGTPYHIECRYSSFDFQKNEQFVLENLGIWGRMLACFERILFIRTPIKQELVPDSEKNEVLRETIKSYEHGWNLTKEYLSENNNRFQFFEPHVFNLLDYQPQDTHWTETGNIKFAEYVREIIKK